jgi:hypothetical protein
MKHFALLAVFSVMFMLLAGCAGQQGAQAPAPGPAAPAQEYKCADGTKAKDASLCPPTPAPPKPEPAKVACPDGSMVADVALCPVPVLNCDDNNQCTTDSVKDGACVFENVADGTACTDIMGDRMTCTSGVCTEVAPPKPVVPVNEMVAATPAELLKLKACGDNFAAKTYHYIQSDAYSTKEYNLKLSNSVDGRAIITTADYMDISAPQYGRVTVTDYRSQDGTCTCNDRQLLMDYKAYGSKNAGRVLEGGTCGKLPSEISMLSSFYDYVQDGIKASPENEQVSLPGYVGMAKRFYQETNGTDGTIVHASFYTTDLLPVPLKVNGTAWYADGSTKQFSLVLLP